MKKALIRIAIGTLVALIVVLVAISVFSQADADQELRSLRFTGEYSTDGIVWHPVEDGIVKKADTVFLRGTFDTDIEDGESVWVRLENAGVRVSVGGEVIYSCFEEGGFPAIFRSPGYAWRSFATAGLEAGAEIAFEVSVYYGNAARVCEALIDGFRVGDGIAFHQPILKSFGFTGTVALIALIVGLLYMTEGILSRKITGDEAKRIGIFGFYCFTGAVWALTDSLYPYFSIVLTPPWLAGLVDMLGMILFPVAIAVLIRYFMREKRTRAIMSFVAASAIAVAIVALILQLCGVRDLYEMQFLIWGAAMAQLIAAVVCIVMELKYHRDAYLIILICSVLPVLLAIAVDSVNYLLGFSPLRFLMRYGLSVSFILLAYQIIVYAKSAKRVADKLAATERELTDSRVAIMLSQIQPHFLYNALGAIRALCAKDAEAARNAIDHFSRYLRGNMDALAQNETIPFEKDLKHLDNYLYIERLRFGDRIRIEFELAATEFMCPPLTLQPLVENAIKHGLTGKAEGGTVSIITREDGSDYILTVKDDGVGFDPATLDRASQEHIGLGNTERRVAAMCAGTVEIESEPGVGTAVTIRIPKRGLL